MSAIEYRTYRLIILQTTIIENDYEQLLNLISAGTDCVEFVSKPVEGTLRHSNGTRGIRKWNDGKIKLKNTGDCHREFTDRSCSTPSFKIRLKKV